MNDMKQVYIVPAKDMVVRDPNTGTPLPAAGALVVWETFWQRRLNDGDISIEKEPSEKSDKSQSASQNEVK